MVPEVSETQQSVALADMANVKVGLSDVNVDSMMNDVDPWMQAKQRQADAAAATSASTDAAPISSITEVVEETASP